MNNEFRNKAFKSKIDDLAKKIKKLEEDLKNSKNKAVIELESEIKTLKAKQAVMVDKYNRLKFATDKSLNYMKLGLNNAWMETKEVYNSVKKSFNELNL